MNEIFVDKTIISILGMVVGTLSLWMGYRLFSRQIEQKGEFEGKVGHYSIIIRNYGPGIFFCLFGAVIIVVALTRPYSVRSEQYGLNGEFIASAASDAASASPEAAADEASTRVK